jgi:hypothetical protein
MRQYTDVKVSHAAVHVVAPKKKRLRQSTAPIQLAPDVTEFLVEHVTKGLADGRALAASFKVTGRDRTEGICRSIISSSRGFVDKSAKLARLLYDASSAQEGSDARVSDGTLVVARCTGEDLGATAVFVAMLKLDPNDGFRAEETKDERGRPVVQLVAQHDILPSPRERLQKAAFVREAGGEYDALALDHQRRGEVVSEFFLDGFLGLEHVLDAKERTTRLYKALHRTFEDVKDQLTDDEYGRVDQYLSGQVVGGRVNVDTIVSNLPLPDELKQRFTDALTQALPDKEFDTDEETAEKLVRRRRRFTGDHGLTVSVPGVHFQDVVDVKPPSDRDDRYTVTIRTRKWTEQ